MGNCIRSSGVKQIKILRLFHAKRELYSYSCNKGRTHTHTHTYTHTHERTQLQTITDNQSPMIISSPLFFPSSCDLGGYLL